LWLSSLFLAVSFTAVFMYQLTREPWLEAAGIIAGVAGLAISLIPWLLARPRLRQNRDGNRR
jgi:hypothetical protein